MAYSPLTRTISSALSYGLALWYPLYSGPLAFLSFLPLAYNARKNLFEWHHGIVWGLLFWNVHFFVFLRVLIEHSTLETINMILFYALLVVYFTFFSTVWFLSIQLATSIQSLKKFGLLFFFINTLVYLYYIDRYSLLLFDVVEGYPFSNPLLPLTQFAAYLSILPRSVILANALCLGLIVALVQCSTLHINQLVNKLKHTAPFFFNYVQPGKNRAIARLHLFNYIPILISFFTLLTACIVISIRTNTLPSKPPAWLSNVVVARLQQNPKPTYCHDALLKLKNILKKSQALTNAKIICMPESTLPYCINALNYFYPLIKKELADKTVILGSHYRENGFLYNCMYIITSKKGNSQYYCKIHGVPFFERTLQKLKSPLLNTMFLHNREPFTQAHGPRKHLLIPGIGAITPYICSDLFFAHQSPKSLNKPIIALCNDAWFSCKYFRELMLLNAQLKAYAWNCTLMYVSYYYSLLLSSNHSWQIPVIT